MNKLQKGEHTDIGGEAESDIVGPTTALVDYGTDLEK